MSDDGQACKSDTHVARTLLSGSHLNSFLQGNLLNMMMSQHMPTKQGKAMCMALMAAEGAVASSHCFIVLGTTFEL